VQPSREVICLDDDDGPKYAGGSSDDDIPEPDANIKPTVFQPKISFKSTGSFKDLMATFARGSSSGNTPKTQIYAQPARALPVDRDVSMSELDLGTRRKVERIQAIVPGRKVADYTNALAKAKGYVDDATQILLDTEPIHILSDDDEASKTATKAKSAKSQETVMKRQLNTKLASIADRYSSTQNARKPPVPLVASPAAVPAKPKRKLVQGRRNPAADSSPVKPSPSAKPEVLNLEDDNIPMSDGDVSDSDVEPESESDEELDGRVLAYLNKCTVEELVDLTNQKEAALSFFLAQRPFKNLNMARLVSDAKELKNGRKSTRAPIGEKIVDTTTDMMTGYEAVDSLVSKCSEVGKPLAEEMAGWGLDIFGAAKTGELEMVSLEEDFHDSGIGTPNSKGASENGDDDVKALAKKPRAKLLKKPKMMSDDLVLKDYQLVGLNWLALLYKHKLSCILADDMGLGKSYLREEYHKLTFL
jgi:SWI/SNF-related matrix-associated actin-dependent regulator 1 of chromatin subfamily A